MARERGVKGAIGKRKRIRGKKKVGLRGSWK
jgi:hypothetical protein